MDQGSATRPVLVSGLLSEAIRVQLIPDPYSSQPH